MADAERASARQDEAGPVSEEELARRAENEYRLRELRRRREEENMVAARDSRLYELFAKAGMLSPEVDGRGRFSLSALMEGGELPDREQRMWLMGFDRIARALPQFGPPPLPGEEKPADASCHIRVSTGGMAAYIFLFPPRYGGEEMEAGRVMEQLDREGIRFGLVAERISMACHNHRYLQLIQVASGLAPIDGEDGEILDHYKRSSEIELKVKEDNTIDFRELGWLQTAEAGGVICDILPPTVAQDGIDVKGRPVPGRDGRPVWVPQGPGTALTKDGSALVAAISGVLSFNRRKGFSIDPLLIIRGDVDNAVGNLDVVGSLLVQGDIRDGFSVKATESITVKGIIEGAAVTAGLNVQVQVGINGAGHGLVRAGGDVISGFIELANVEAEGSVIAGSIVNSSVVAGDAAEAMAGHGVIVGGSITAHNRVQALVVGHRAGRSMQINLGNSAAFVAEKRELLEKRNALEAEIAAKETNIRYLQGRGNLSGGERAMIQGQKQSLPMLKMQVKKLNNHLAVMNRGQDLNQGCVLKADVIYPPVELMMGGADAILQTVLYEAEVVLEEGKIAQHSDLKSAPDAQGQKESGEAGPKRRPFELLGL